MTPARFAASFAHGLAPCYLIAGDEPLLVRECVDALRQAARQAGYLERETLDTGVDFDWGRLAQICATGSLFAAQRIVEVRLGVAPNAAGGKILKALAAEADTAVLLVVIAGRLETAVRKGAWYAQFEAKGVACYAWPVRSDEFPAWLDTRLRGAGVQVDAEVRALLARQTEGNLLAAAQEIDKLRLLCPDGRVSLKTASESLADSAHFGVFDWIDHLFEGDRVAAVRGLTYLRESGVAMPPVTRALAINLRQLAAAVHGAATIPGVFQRRQSLLRKAASRPSARGVAGWLRRLAEIDRLSKSGSEAEAWREIQQLALAVAGARGPLTGTQLAAARRTL
ncbi:MAG TPA: DNA polymerase III subunit delta [Nevskiaceae bacterium]|nr:DNA polymerase III subunit delta [Nevskiaceae bacterium]